MKKLFVLLFLSAILFSCKHRYSVSGVIQNRPPFKEITGLRFVEVRRTFKDGYAFNKEGFQLEPGWRMFFMSDDSVQTYSPEQRRFVKFKVTYSHDSVFNFAGQWFKLKEISRDSLMFQLLEVNTKVISSDFPVVNMKFYAQNYIREKLHTTAEELQKPRKRDSLYIRERVKKADLDTVNAFAARTPVVLKSRSPLLHISKTEASRDLVANKYNYDNYMNPQYTISIDKAYKDFYYDFSAVIDFRGKIWFQKSLTMEMPEFKEAHARVMKGIIEVYLQRLLDITPGNTLGFPHASVVSFKVTGKTG